MRINTMKTMNCICNHRPSKYFELIKLMGISIFWLLSSQVPTLAETVKPIRTFHGHAWYVNSVAISNDNHTALSGSLDNTLKLWDINTGQEIRTFRGGKSWILSIAISKDGRTALSGGMFDDALKLWDIETGQEIRTFKGHTRSIFSVAISKNGNAVLSGSSDQTLKLWDIKTGREVRTFLGHNGTITSVTFLDDERYVLSGSLDKTLKLWRIKTAKNIRTFRGHTDKIRSVSSNGNYALSGSDDKTLKLWDITTGQEIRTFSGHSGRVWSVAFSSDGLIALSGSDDNTLKLWDIKTGQEIRTFKAHTSTVRAVAFSPDGHYALSGSTDNTLRLWGTHNALPTASFTVTPKIGPAPLTVTLDGSASIDTDGNITNYGWWIFNNQIASGVTSITTKTFQEPGLYTIRLAVTDNTGGVSTNTAQHTVTVEKPAIPPKAAFTITPSQGQAPLTVNLDANRSFDSDGSIINYEWTINDQLLGSRNPFSHILTAIGQYMITLKVTDNQGLTANAQQIVSVMPPNQPPVAHFTITPSQGQAPLLVQLNAGSSQDIDGSIVNYEWFVNGQKMSGLIASATLTAVGEYPIILTVTDNQGLTANTQQNVSVNANQAPIALFTIMPSQGQAPLTVNLDASYSKDIDGSIVNYEWAVDGQLKTSGNPTTYTFADAGTYMMTLTVMDNKRLRASTQQIINVISPNQPPQAYFTLTPSQGQAPLTIDLNASDSEDTDGSIVSYEWLVNGQKLSGLIAKTTLTAPGEYPLVLTIKDNQGLTAETQQIVKVIAPNQAPQAHFTMKPSQGQVPFLVTLDASGSEDTDGSITDYEWLVNGQKLLGMMTSTTLTTAGEYPIILTVTDNQGLSTNIQQSVSVTPNQTSTDFLTIKPSQEQTPYAVTLETSHLPETKIVKNECQPTTFGNSATYAFTNAGEYVMKFLVPDNKNLTASTQQAINENSPNQAPVAYFTITSPPEQAALTRDLNASEAKVSEKH
jgi:WD40 repeat protein